MDKIKVAIVDDDLAWIKLIINLIHQEEDIIVLWSATNKETAINRAGSELLDIIIIDNGLDGDRRDCEGIRQIAEISKAKVIMMTSSFDEELIKNSTFSGLANYILKKDYQSIPVLIRLIYNQISPMEVIFRDYHKTKNELELRDLTLTERELYLLKKQGYTVLQMAIKTHKSVGTIRNQLSKVYKKLKNKR